MRWMRAALLLCSYVHARAQGLDEPRPQPHYDLEPDEVDFEMRAAEMFDPVDMNEEAVDPGRAEERGAGGPVPPRSPPDLRTGPTGPPTAPAPPNTPADDFDDPTLDIYTYVALLDIVFTDGCKRSCTGAIIHENVIITAAHCFTFLHNAFMQPELSLSFVVFGTRKMFDTGYEQYVPIERVVTHPRFRGWTADLALVFTFASLAADRPGRLIPLATKQSAVPVDTNVTVLSWGHCPEQKDSTKGPGGGGGNLFFRSGAQHNNNNPKHLQVKNINVQKTEHTPQPPTVKSTMLHVTKTTDHRRLINSKRQFKQPVQRYPPGKLGRKQYGNQPRLYRVNEPTPPPRSNRPPRIANHWRPRPQQRARVPSRPGLRQEVLEEDQLEDQQDYPAQSYALEENQQEQEEFISEIDDNDDQDEMYDTNPEVNMKMQAKQQRVYHDRQPYSNKNQVLTRRNANRTLARRAGALFDFERVNMAVARRKFNNVAVAGPTRSDLQSAASQTTSGDKKNATNNVRRRIRRHAASNTTTAPTKETTNRTTTANASEATKAVTKTITVTGSVSNDVHKKTAQHVSLQKINTTINGTGSNFHNGRTSLLKAYEEAKNQSKPSRRAGVEDTKQNDLRIREQKRNYERLTQIYQNTKNDKNRRQYAYKSGHNVSRWLSQMSEFKNYRRAFETKRSNLTVGLFGYVNIASCTKIIQRSLPPMYEIRNSNEVLCFSSEELFITNEDSGAPVVQRGALVAVTVGGVDSEGDHVAVGIRLACFCSWIAQHLPNNDGAKLDCCDDCCRKGGKADYPAQNEKKSRALMRQRPYNPYVRPDNSQRIRDVVHRFVDEDDGGQPEGQRKDVRQDNFHSGQQRNVRRNRRLN